MILNLSKSSPVLCSSTPGHSLNISKQTKLSIALEQVKLNLVDCVDLQYEIDHPIYCRPPITDACIADEKRLGGGVHLTSLFPLVDTF